MKMKMTDLMDNLSAELLEEVDKSRPNILILKKKEMRKRLIFAAAIMVTILGGCSAYVAFKMPDRFRAYFHNSSDILVDEMYINGIDYVDYENYRLAVEGIISDVNSKKILITVTAISDKAKENFIDTCPTPIMINGGGSGGSIDSNFLFSNQYKKEFNYEIESDDTECSVILYEGVDNEFEFYTKEFNEKISQITDNLIDEKGYSRLAAYDIARKQAIKEKVGKVLTFSIASKDSNEIILEINENNSISSCTVNKVAITKAAIIIYGSGLLQEISTQMQDIVETDGLSSTDIEPTVYAIFDNGTEKLLIKGNMGYKADGYALSTNSSSEKKFSTGEFNRFRYFAEPIDIDRILKVRVNDIDYPIKK